MQGALGTTEITQIAHDSNSAFKIQGKLMDSVQQRMQSSVKWFLIPYCNEHFAITCQDCVDHTMLSYLENLLE